MSASEEFHCDSCAIEEKVDDGNGLDVVVCIVHA